MDQAKQQDLFRGSSTQLYIPAFTQKDFESTSLSTQDSHTGNHHRGFWGNNNREYTTPLFTNTTSH